MAAEAEAVGHDLVYADLSRCVRNVVEVASFTGMVEVDRRRKHIGMNGQSRDDELDAAGGTKVWPSWLFVLEICKCWA